MWSEQHAWEGAVSAGKIHVLDLGRLKTRFGSRWGRVSEHVQVFFESAIKQELGPGDTCCQTAEFTYLLTFPQLSQSQAQLKCIAVSERVCRRLFGENGEHISFRNVVARLDGDMLPKGADIPAELDALLEQRGAETIVNRSAEEVDQDCSFEEFRVGYGEHPGFRCTTTTGDLSFHYRPLWDATRKVVLIYLCQPVPAGLPLGDATETSGFCTVEDEDMHDIGTKQAHLDLIVLRECIRRIKQLSDCGLRVMVAAPVHFSTIARPKSWTEYSAQFKNLATRHARDLAFFVFGMSAGLPNIRLAQELPKLSAGNRPIFCAVGKSDANIKRFAGTGIHAIGSAIAPSTSEKQAIAEMKILERVARDAGMAAFALGVRSTSLALNGLEAGLRYLEGAGVRPSITDPRYAFAQNLEDLYTAKRLHLAE